MNGIKAMAYGGLLLLMCPSYLKAEPPRDCALMILADPESYMLKDVTLYVRDVELPAEDFEFGNELDSVNKYKVFWSSTRGLTPNDEFVNGGMIHIVIGEDEAGEFARTAKVANWQNPDPDETLTIVKGTFWMRKNNYPNHYVKVTTFQKSDIKVPPK